MRFAQSNDRSEVGMCREWETSTKKAIHMPFIPLSYWYFMFVNQNPIALNLFDFIFSNYKIFMCSKKSRQR
jgi:hypothetical protein